MSARAVLGGCAFETSSTAPASGRTMINTLTWLMNTAGDGGGGFFSTHPGTGERIEVLRKL